MKVLVAFVLALAAGALPCQDSKPAGKPASAPAARPVEFRVLNRKATVSLPADWAVTEAPSTFALDGWTPAAGWKHATIAGCAIHVFGAEGPGLTPAGVAKKWLEAAGSAKCVLKVEVPGKSRQMKGLDVEVELDENGAVSFYWLRAIAGAKDRVFVLLAEASPLDYFTLETVVRAAGPVLDSFMDPGRRDPWKRDPDVTITRGTLVARFAPPAGWAATRLAPEGSLIWMGAESFREFVLAFPQTSMQRTPFGRGPDISPEDCFDLTVKTSEMMRVMGRLVSSTPSPGPPRSHEIVTVSRPLRKQNEPPLWSRRRVILHEGAVISLLAKVPLTAGYDSLPSDAVQKQVTAVFDSLRFETVK